MHLDFAPVKIARLWYRSRKKEKKRKMTIVKKLVKDSYIEFMFTDATKADREENHNTLPRVQYPKTNSRRHLATEGKKQRKKRLPLCLIQIQIQWMRVIV